MTDQGGSVSYQKPPRPVPFGRSSTDPNNASSSFPPGFPRKESTGDLSNDSRADLRKELTKRRMSLTPQEQGFLEELIIHGNEVDVTMAHQTLCDDDLFFEQEEGDGISLGTAEHPASDPGMSSADMEQILKTSERLRSSDTLGSAKRQEHLSFRRSSVTYGKLWKAHEHGVSMTGTRQRRKSIACLREGKNNVVRRSSFLSTETANLLENGGPLMKQGEDGIFRRTNEDKVFRSRKPSLRMTIHGRKKSWDKGRQAAKPKRPILRRLASEGSRKSVSFAEYDDEDGDHPTRLPGIPRRVMRKRNVSTDTDISDLGTDLDDDVSIPSLHHPTAVRSDSVSSIPSLHHPTPIHSDSVASIHSIHHAHHIHGESEPSSPRSDSPTSDVENVDTSMSEISLASIPSLHHGHPLRDESLASFLSTTSPPEKESREPDPITKAVEEPVKPQLLRHPSQEPKRPVLMRLASRNIYDGEGIEVEELPPEIEVDNVSKARKYRSMLSFGDSTSVLSSISFDQAMNRDSIFRERDLRRSLSDEALSNFFLGSMSPLSAGQSATSLNTLRPEEDDASWDMETDSRKGHYDAWNVFTEDPSYGAGRGESGLPFRVLGTSADDKASTPHVLSPPLMDSLRNFVPYSLTEANFWMKFSLLRDGDSFHSLLQKTRGTAYTVIAIETVDGEVFGSFTSEPWRKNWKYFGNGESFLWRMRQSRTTPCFDVFDQAKMESELDVYPWAGENECIQLCTHDKLAVGGGSVRDGKKADDPGAVEYGFGLAIEKDLLYGTSTSCATFASPPLSLEHSDGSPFEIVNLEVWAMTPCNTLEDAEKLELGKLFLRKTN